MLGNPIVFIHIGCYYVMASGSTKTLTFQAPGQFFARVMIHEHQQLTSLMIKLTEFHALKNLTKNISKNLIVTSLPKYY